MDLWTFAPLIIVLAILYGVGKIIVGWLKPNGKVSADGSMICTHCGVRGTPKTETRGSTAIELVLWLCLIVPGLIYSIWRLTTRRPVCPACGAADMIPIGTPRGQALIASMGQAASTK